jgi:hypothetical protein
MTWIRCGKCGFHGSTYLKDNSCPNCGNKAVLNLTALNKEMEKTTWADLKEQSEKLLAKTLVLKGRVLKGEI